MKKNYYFKSCIAAVALTMGLSASAQKSVCINFEDAATVEFVSENTSDQVTTEVIDLPAVARSGSKVVKIHSMSRSIGFLIRETRNPIVVSGNEYVHVIIYAGSPETTPQAAISMTNGIAAPNNWGATPAFSAINTLTATKRYTGNKKYADTDAAYIANAGADMTVYPRLRCHPQSTNTINQIVYFDDLVMYAHASTTTDLVAPEAATNFSFVSQTATSNEISWTEGVDATTGVQLTYILRTTNASAEAPVLMPQVGYSIAGGAAGANTVGDWTVIATLNGGTATYTDNSVVEGTSYRYAVVHKDLAYNNSAALLSSNPTTSVNKNSITKFNCTGGINKIELNALTLGEKLSIFNITGAKVVEQKVENSNLTIALAKGIYLVRVSDVVIKVVVR